MPLAVHRQQARCGQDSGHGHRIGVVGRRVVAITGDHDRCSGLPIPGSGIGIRCPPGPVYARGVTPGPKWTEGARAVLGNCGLPPIEPRAARVRRVATRRTSPVCCWRTFQGAGSRRHRARWPAWVRWLAHRDVARRPAAPWSSTSHPWRSKVSVKNSKFAVPLITLALVRGGRLGPRREGIVGEIDWTLVEPAQQGFPWFRCDRSGGP